MITEGGREGGREGGSTFDVVLVLFQFVLGGLDLLPFLRARALFVDGLREGGREGGIKGRK